MVAVNKPSSSMQIKVPIGLEKMNNRHTLAQWLVEPWRDWDSTGHFWGCYFYNLRLPLGYQGIGGNLIFEIFQYMIWYISLFWKQLSRSRNRKFMTQMSLPRVLRIHWTVAAHYWKKLQPWKSWISASKASPSPCSFAGIASHDEDRIQLGKLV